MTSEHTSSQPVLSGSLLGALGVVFGDIGTSPLYALSAAVAVVVPSGGIVDESVALGLASLVFWSLFLVITVKYVLVILRTDQDGEGGVLALLALLDLRRRGKNLSDRVLLLVAIIGGAMLFGDGVVTPAISVLSAVEGLGEWSSAFSPYTVPIAMVILSALFLAQRYGAHRIGAWFGPVMLLWFVVLGAGGALAIAQHPSVLRAVSPVWAVTFLSTHTGVAAAVLGAVFLAVTGGEALYADLGQFGRRTITHAWLLVAMPALLLSYFGQAALLLDSPQVAVSHVFFDLYPKQILLPVVLLATCATVIASQAVISGVFSMARQALRLDLLPAMKVRFHSDTNPHDVHLPFANALLAVLSLSMVVVFGSSGALANAYGISVAGAMVTTTVLYLAVCSRRIQSFRGLALVVVAACVFLSLDMVFVLANVSKIADGGAVPLSIAGIISLLIIAWMTGRKQATEERSLTPGRAVRTFIDGHRHRPDAPVGVFLIAPHNRFAAAYEELVERCGSEFSQLWLVSVRTESRPRVPIEERVKSATIATNLFHVDVSNGYLQPIDLPALIAPVLREQEVSPAAVNYIVSLHRPVITTGGQPLARALLKIYAVMARLGARETDAWHLPRSRTIEVGIPRVLEVTRYRQGNSDQQRISIDAQPDTEQNDAHKT